MTKACNYFFVYSTLSYKTNEQQSRSDLPSPPHAPSSLYASFRERIFQVIFFHVSQSKIFEYFNC